MLGGAKERLSAGAGFPDTWLLTLPHRMSQGTLLGTDHVYVIPGADKAKKGGPPGLPGRPGAADVEVTLTPEEMEGLDEAGIRALYEEKVGGRTTSRSHGLCRGAWDWGHSERQKYIR